MTITDCNCHCHTTPGITHITPCCSGSSQQLLDIDDLDNLVKEATRERDRMYNECREELPRTYTTALPDLLGRVVRVMKTMMDKLSFRPSETTIEEVCHSNWAEINKRLGEALPCYDKTGGCVLSSDQNETRCGESCFILNVYREGVVAGLAHKNEVLQPLGRAIEQHLRDYGEDRPDHQGQPIMLYMSDVKKIRELLMEK